MIFLNCKICFIIFNEFEFEILLILHYFQFIRFIIFQSKCAKSAQGCLLI